MPDGIFIPSAIVFLGNNGVGWVDGSIVNPTNECWETEECWVAIKTAIQPTVLNDRQTLAIPARQETAARQNSLRARLARPFSGRR
jgi:hypothetical protein